ncbi:MAG: murein biosynthesis integral membrane protein MurJ [Holosporales bacterium]|jgi:putative peptidoglycan lipid II flippase|nr:murein biosynthesis integral membrane protein MurJ [Holosporales bacterium]
MAFAQRFFTVSGLTVASRLLGVVREVILIHFLGASVEMDAFTTAFKFPCFFRRFFAEGGFQSIFVPFFTDYYATGKINGSRCFVSRLFSLIFWAMLIVTVLIMVFAKEFTILMAPGFLSDPAKLDLATKFTMVIFPSVLFVALSTVFSGILLARKKFLLYSMGPIFVNVVLIIFLVSGQNLISAGWRISYGVLVAGIFLFFYMYYYVKREGLPCPSLSSVKITSGIKLFLKKLTPILAGAGVAQINVFVGSMFASFLPTGCITYIYCADRFVQLPLAMFGISMGIVLLPEIAEALSKKRATDLKHIQNRSLLFTMRLTLPSVVGLVTLSYYMISLMYGHGKFTNDAVIRTSYVLKIVSLGLPAYVMTKVMSSVLFAQKDSRTPVVAAVVSIVTNILLSLIFIAPLKELGIATANALSSFVNVYVMCRKTHWWSTVEKSQLKSLFKIVLASVVMALCVFVLMLFFAPISKFEEAMFIISACIIGLLTYAISLYALKDSAIKACFNVLRQKGNDVF